MIFNLNLALRIWDLREVARNRPVEKGRINENLTGVLDELTSRFVSDPWTGLFVRSAPGMIDFESVKGQTYPRLRALQKALPEDYTPDIALLCTLGNLFGLEVTGSKRETGS